MNYSNQSYRYVSVRKYNGKNQTIGRRSRRLYPETIQPFGTQNPNQKDY
jgi:hypothetical protein